MRRSSFVIGTLASAALAGSALATAGPQLTNICPPSKVGELNHQQILALIYGGTFAEQTTGFSNGVVTAERIFDSGVGSPLDLFLGNRTTADDNVWSGGPATIQARAKYAADNHTFGWFNDANEGAFAPILNTSTFNSPVNLTLSPSFRWALKNNRTTRMFTSRMTDNLDANEDIRDMMVTYRVSGPNIAGNTWLLFWEDRILGDQFVDCDYNDAVIEVNVIPAPGAVTLAGLGGLLMLRRRRK